MRRPTSGVSPIMFVFTFSLALAAASSQANYRSRPSESRSNARRVSTPIRPSPPFRRDGLVLDGAVLELL